MTDLVDLTLRDWRSHPFVYGESDCMLSMGKYVAAAGGKDITGDFLGRYSTQAEALAIMEEHGGAGALFAAMGLERVEGQPQRGDALELVHSEIDTIGALCTGEGVAVRLERGVTEVDLRFVKWRGAWRVVR
ncbi:DUF6950 family protein [Sphingopyxis sp. 113P3]|uniref:DUF6950 family protein n=1 Tax=Sphingopyxis sp. (strain 113P3) TaxID=292913 RepID=UPI0006AD5DC0|nr:hypothetical protein [Sphingopyxis sp. 113P3]ALC12464.1 hypothetical protein LH20_10930 [Sphingopyxis sp. 113P3]